MNADLTIRLQRVTKSFGETRALVDCDLTAATGEVHAIVGENGSGKSTLAKIISGVLAPDAGEVDILRAGPIRSPLDAHARGVATIFQEVLVADEASILENLFVGSDGLLRHGGSRAERMAEARALMTRFTGLDIDPDRTVGDLPLSLKQWVVIGRAILRRPRVLILDESSAALDLDATNRLHAEINRLRATGTTILIVTHRIAELVRIADRATILRDGAAVGVLERGEITESRLLELMTPANRSLAAHAAGTARASTKGGSSILAARGIRLRPGTVAFDFDLQAGTIVGLAGLDGQGQDAFAQVLAGIEPPFEGDVATTAKGGRACPVVDLASAQDHGIAWVSGDRKREGILPQQSIFENFAVGVYRTALGTFGIVDRQRAAGLFEEEVKRFSIKTGRRTNRITSLSGGNQQKILIGRAFATAPRVIVFNDPARGVDLATKRDLYRELLRFAQDGGAVVYLSSEIEEFLGFADRVDVFVNETLSRSLTGAEVNEEDMLAAMFGQARGTHIEIGVEAAG